MQVSEKLFDKTFEGKTQKDAYLKCCKWVASNIIAMNNCQHITYTAEKQNVVIGGKLKLTVYVTAEEQEVYEHMCEVCKEVGGLLYTTEGKYRCYSCKVNPYRKRMQERLKLLKDGMKGSVLK